MPFGHRLKGDTCEVQLVQPLSFWRLHLDIALEERHYDPVSRCVWTMLFISIHATLWKKAWGSDQEATQTAQISTIIQSTTLGRWYQPLALSADVCLRWAGHATLHNDAKSKNAILSQASTSARRTWKPRTLANNKSFANYALHGLRFDSRFDWPTCKIMTFRYFQHCQKSRDLFKTCLHGNLLHESICQPHWQSQLKLVQADEVCPDSTQLISAFCSALRLLAGCSHQWILLLPLQVGTNGDIRIISNKVGWICFEWASTTIKHVRSAA